MCHWLNPGRGHCSENLSSSSHPPFPHPHLPSLPRSSHLHFLASDSRFQVTAQRGGHGPRPTMHPVWDTCQLHRLYQSAEQGSSFTRLNAPNKPFPTVAKCQAFQSHLTGWLCLPYIHIGGNQQEQAVVFNSFLLIYKREETTRYPPAATRWIPNYICMAGFHHVTSKIVKSLKGDIV